MTSHRLPKELDSELVMESSHFVQILDVGNDALLTRIQLIRSAKKKIDIQTFIWSDDDVGRLMFYELLQAAKRGVKVRIVADQMFCDLKIDSLAFACTAHPNLQIRFFKPGQDRFDSSMYDHVKTFALGFKDANMRMHNKVFIADDWAITGGRNIENCYYDRDPGLNFKDRDVMIKGPVVEKMRNSFEEYWNCPVAVPGVKLTDVAGRISSGAIKSYDSPEDMKIVEIVADVDRQLTDINIVSRLYSSLQQVEKVAFIADHPDKNRSMGMGGSSILNECVAYSVSQAKESVMVQSPYLVMSKRAEKIFRRLRKDHPEIKLTFSTNSLAATDSWPTYALFYKQKKELLADLKVDVFEYKPLPQNILSMMPEYPALVKRATGDDFSGIVPKTLNGVPYLCLHAKTFVVDNELCYIGSYNFDPRSANLNTEVGLVIWDRDFAKLVSESIESDCMGGNSWVTWKKKRVVGLSHLNDLISTLSGVVASVTTIDVWPSGHASCFELKEGREPIPTSHPQFYENYEDVGNFPMVGVANEKTILVQLFRSLGQVLKPLL